MTETDTPFAAWCIVELMGHRRLAGHITECEIAGKGFLRLDIPADDHHAAATQLYNPGSVYAITPTSEEIARAVAADCRPEPVHHWELRKAITTAAPDDDDEERW